MTLPAELYYASIDSSTAMLAAVVDCTDPGLPIPSCPDWTMRDLAAHLGRVQRWAAEITATRSATYLDSKAIPDGKLPDDQAARGAWLTAGAGRLVTALRGAGDAQVWMFTGTGPASFWARRQAHEVAVHCADAQLAAGDEVSIPAELSADAIDEWLTIMSGPLGGRPDRRANALPLGRTLRVHATDPGLGVASEWLVRHSGDGVQVRSGHDTAGAARADALFAGPATELLLVLLGRLPSGHQAVTVGGDASLVGQWLAGTSF